MIDILTQLSIKFDRIHLEFYVGFSYTCIESMRKRRQLPAVQVVPEIVAFVALAVATFQLDTDSLSAIALPVVLRSNLVGVERANRCVGEH